MFELGQLIAGPFSAKTLADFGAEVVNIEQPGIPKAVRELVWQLGRYVKRVHQVVRAITDLGLVALDEPGGVLCAHADVYLDMYVHCDGVAA